MTLVRTPPSVTRLRPGFDPGRYWEPARLDGLPASLDE